MKNGLLSVVASALLMSTSTAALALNKITITGAVKPAQCVLNFDSPSFSIGDFEADDLLNQFDYKEGLEFRVVPTAGCVAGSKVRLSAATHNGDYYNIDGPSNNALALKIHTTSGELKPNTSHGVQFGTPLVLTPRVVNFNGNLPTSGGFTMVLTATFSLI